MTNLAADNDRAWNCWRKQWSLPPGVIYLNHGSFGPSPVPLQEARIECIKRLESEPFDFFVRQLADQLTEARRRLGAFVGASPDDLVFVDNATTGMNIVAASVPLQPGDEVLTTDHEYGAALRIWQRACGRAGAKLVVKELPCPLVSADEALETLLDGVTARTRLLLFSHVTSPTAVILPTEAICQRARELGLTICIDGPHAPGMIPLNLGRLDCDYYAASCHKWLSAPFGSGFLYVHPRVQNGVQPVVMSWGQPPKGRSGSWHDELWWPGTRDPSAFLAMPAALEFLEGVGLEAFRERTHWLARYARQRITDLTGLETLVPDSPEWYGSMISLPLPPGEAEPLQDALWEHYRIEVPIIPWQGRRLIRLSCHLYNQSWEIDRLLEALAVLLS